MARKDHSNTEEVETADVEGAEATGDETVAAEVATKKSKDPMPEGFGTPVDFVHYLKEKRDIVVRPQVIYGYTKNNKEFQKSCDQHTDGRMRLNLESALAWYDGLDARKAERAAAKEAKDAAKAAKADTPVEA